MPRWALAALLVAFILPGIFGHELWPQDATGFGRIWAMASGNAADWLFPNVAGALAPQGGPLPYWVGAALVRALGSLIGNVNAAATANLLWYAIATFCIWQGTYRLARRDEAQPVAGAFGGEAKRKDYARLMADVAALLTIGTIGVILRFHQIREDGASVAIVATAVLASSLIEWNRKAAAALAGACAGALALTQGPVPALGLLLASLIVLVRTGAGRIVPVVLLLGAATLALLWPLAAFHWYPQEASAYFDAWRTAQAPGWLGLEGLPWIARNATWFLWPVWPLAAWAVYAWRASLHAAHLQRPLILLAGLLAALLFNSPLEERFLVPLIAPLVVLAAFGAITLRRALDNAIDWLAIAIFSLALIFCWAYYLAMQLGAPRAMAASIARLAPGYIAHVSLPALAMAAAVALGWGQLIGWRILRRPRVLWRGPMLAAAGVTIVWITANLLFLPAVDYVLSYRSFAMELAERLHARGLNDGCVQAHRIPMGERAIIAYYGGVRFDREGSSETCRLALHFESRRSALDNDPPPGVHGMWELAWEGRRRARPDEIWRIWVRAQ